MKKTVLSYVAGFMTATILTCGIAYASTTKTIEILYDNIKVYKDNVLCELKDANGSAIEPFIYNGTTYMPVRGTANLAGMDVTWDGTTKSVYLWSELSSPNDTYLMDVCPPYEVSSGMSYQGWGTYRHYTEYLLKDAKYFEMAGTKYTNGFALHDGGKYALFALNGKYKEITFTLGHVDNTGMTAFSVQFYVDNVLVKEFTIQPEAMPQKVTVPLNNGLQLKVFTPDSVDGHPYVGLGNITIK